MRPEGRLPVDGTFQDIKPQDVRFQVRSRIVEIMEPTIVYWCYIGIMDMKMESTI